MLNTWLDTAQLLDNLPSLDGLDPLCCRHQLLLIPLKDPRRCPTKVAALGQSFHGGRRILSFFIYQSSLLPKAKALPPVECKSSSALCWQEPFATQRCDVCITLGHSGNMIQKEPLVLQAEIRWLLGWRERSWISSTHPEGFSSRYFSPALSSAHEGITPTRVVPRPQQVFMSRAALQLPMA